MTENLEELLQTMNENKDDYSEFMDKVLASAQPGTVYGEPAVDEYQTVITASEALAGGAAGSGGGIGVGFFPTEASPDEELTTQVGSGDSAGRGRVGFSYGRPVAAIILNSEGVRIEPIVDVTKIGLAFLTTLGAILITLFKIRSKVKRSR